MATKFPIEFPVLLKDRKLTASVLWFEDNPVQYIYRISFSDGYEDTFCLTDEGKIVGDNLNESKPYAHAIRSDIGNVIGLNTDNFYHIFQETIDGVKTNVWVIEKKDENNNTYFGVYYTNGYQFELRKVEDQWIYSTRSQAPDSKIDTDVAKKVENLLHSLVD